MDVWQILFIAMTVVTIVTGARWKHFKSLVKELAEALAATSDAIEDDKITDLEKKNIAKEWTDVIVAGKKLIGK